MDAGCVFNPNDPARISLPQLEHLELTVLGCDNEGRPESRFLAFLGSLSLTGLEFLKISWALEQAPNQPYYWTDGHARFVDFLEELGGHLKALHLEGLPFSTQQVIRCLQMLPRIQHLNLRHWWDQQHDFINDELLGALTQQPGYSDVLPFLQGIGLKSSCHSFNNPTLLRFIASRWRYQESSSGQLEAVDLDFDFRTGKRCAQYRPRRFEDLKQGSLDVAACLKSEFNMVEVLSSFLNRDSYPKLYFSNRDFPLDIHSLLIFG